MKKFVCCLGIVIGIFSCKDSDNFNIKPISNNLNENFNGINVFENEKQLDNLMIKLKYDKDFMQQWDLNQKEFMSFQKEYSKNLSEHEKSKIIENNGNDVIFLKRTDDEIEAVPHIENMILRKIANSNGLVLIGKDAVKFEYGRKIYFKNYNPNMLLEYKKGILVTGVSIQKSQNLRILGTNSAQNDSRHNYFRSDLRLKVRYDFDDNTSLVNYYSSISMWGELQDRFGGVWWNRIADKISVKSNISNYYGEYSKSSTQYNNNSTYIYDYNPGLSSWFLKSGGASFTVIAECIENGGQYEGSASVSR
jgi:hypothetical protein